jgi:carotenoid 1,2-hydratase
MTGLRLQPPPSGPGAYRWYYADVVAGDTTAVFVFMLGSLFSPRYAARARRGGRAVDCCAVNFALYQRGLRQQWVLSEYSGAQASSEALRIGDSQLALLPDGTVELFIRARTAPFGSVTKAALTLTPEGPGLLEQPLVSGLPHHWAPLALRARATLRLPLLDRVLVGRGYLDTNAGAAPLGVDLPGWTWARVHSGEATHVSYRLSSGEGLHVHGTAEAAVAERRPLLPAASGLTGWGLRVPRALEAGPLRLESPSLLESSPFYARLEASGRQGHALAEVADFRRFRSPLIRWMAHFRTRVERAA